MNKPKYYWTHEDHVWVARQICYREALSQGNEHPHDVIAFAVTTQDMLGMQKLLGGIETFENPVKEGA